MASKNPKKRLFEDDDEENEIEADQKDSFQINDEYAKRFEHNKKREDKQKLEEKYGKAAASDEDSEDSEDSEDGVSEDEDGYLLTEDLDARMTAALQAIKNKDPRIYDSKTKFFDPSEIDKVAEEAAAAKASDSKPQQKPIFLRDYHRERYLSGDIGADDEEDDNRESSAPQTYQQEQDEAKKALISAMADDGEDGSDDNDDADTFLKPKKKAAAATSAAEPNTADQTGIHSSRADRVPSAQEKKKKKKQKKLSESDVANADKDPELFLSNFMASRAWVPEDDENGGPDWQAFESDDDDEEERDRAEEFETAYNMRFEDPSKSNEVLKSYSRSVVAERSVRREQKTGRQRQREQEKEREAEMKRERREERARLRKLRIEEAQEKLAQIKQAAGIGAKMLAEDDWTAMLDDAWDTEKWEAKMKEQFGDLYYAEKDAELEEEKEDEHEEDGEDNGKGKSKGKRAKKTKPKKPKWDDDIDIKDLIPDFDDSNPKITLSDDEADGQVDEDNENLGNEDYADDYDEDDAEQQAKRRKTAKDHKQDRADRKRQARRERARIEAIVDRKLELDEPTALAGSSSTGTGTGRFRYRETSPQSFGLTSHDILLAPSDAALNDFAGLKKLATFRDEERKRKDRKKLGKKARLRQWRRETFGADFEMTGPTYGFERLMEDEEVDDTKNKRGSMKNKGSSLAKERGDGDEKSGKKRKRSGRKGKADA